MSRPRSGSCHVHGCVAVSALLLGCKNAPSPFKPIAGVKQLMQGIIDPNADAIWDAVDSIDTAAGTEERRPRIRAEWAALRNSAIRRATC
jgi:hypothetical protein